MMKEEGRRASTSASRGGASRVAQTGTCQGRTMGPRKPALEIRNRVCDMVDADRQGRTNPRIRVKALRRVTWGRVLALCAPRTETKRDCRADAHGNPRWFPFRDLLCFWFLVLLQVELEASPMPWTSFLFVSLWWNLRTCQLLGVFSRGLPPGPFPFGAHKTILPQQ